MLNFSHFLHLAAKIFPHLYKTIESIKKKTCSDDSSIKVYPVRKQKRASARQAWVPYIQDYGRKTHNARVFVLFCFFYHSINKVECFTMDTGLYEVEGHCFVSRRFFLTSHGEQTNASALSSVYSKRN